MVRTWLVATDDAYHGRVVAYNEVEADKLLFIGICNNKYPVESWLIEVVKFTDGDVELLDDDIEEVEDQNILHTDEIIS